MWVRLAALSLMTNWLGSFVVLAPDASHAAMLWVLRRSISSRYARCWSTMYNCSVGVLALCRAEKLVCYAMHRVSSLSAVGSTYGSEDWFCSVQEEDTAAAPDECSSGVGWVNC